MKMNKLEWNVVDMSVSLVSNESGWTWMEWGGCECKSSGGRVKRLEWNEVNVGVSLVEGKWKDLSGMRWMWV